MTLSVEQRAMLQRMTAEERVQLLASRYHKTAKVPDEVPGQLPLFSNYDLGTVPVDIMRRSDADPLGPVRRELQRMERWNREHGK